MTNASREEIAVAACRRVFMAARALGREMDRVLAPIGLNGPQFGILIELEKHGSMPLGEIGKRLRVTCGNVTGLIDKLVAAGYVRRVALPDDRRVTLAELTEDGEKMMREQRPLHRECMARFVEALDDRQLDDINEILAGLLPPDIDEPGYPAERKED